MACLAVHEDCLPSADTLAADPVRLNAGGAAYVDVAGNNWAPDTFSSGGTTSFSTSAIANTTDDSLYQYYRNGVMSYAIPLGTAGSYTVTLKFNEPSKTAANLRKFDVTMEGSLVLDDFDIYATAGGKNIALDQSFAVTVSDGYLNIAFSQVTDNPIVSAIQVVWAGASPATPAVTYSYRGDNLRNSKLVSGGSTVTYTWDLNAGLPVVLQDGAQTNV